MMYESQVVYVGAYDDSTSLEHFYGHTDPRTCAFCLEQIEHSRHRTTPGGKAVICPFMSTKYLDQSYGLNLKEVIQQYVNPQDREVKLKEFIARLKKEGFMKYHNPTQMEVFDRALEYMLALFINNGYRFQEAQSPNEYGGRGYNAGRLSPTDIPRDGGRGQGWYGGRYAGRGRGYASNQGMGTGDARRMGVATTSNMATTMDAGPTTSLANTVTRLQTLQE